MSDKEEEWKPSGRPQSTMALSLAATLDDAFMLDSDVDNLSNSVHYKKQQVTIQNRELERLEAQIREAEDRLKGGAQGQRPDSSGTDETAKQSNNHKSTDKKPPDAADRSGNSAGNGKAHAPSDSSASQPSDEESAGSAESAGSTTQAPSKRYYRKGGNEAEEAQKGNRPQF